MIHLFVQHIHTEYPAHARALFQALEVLRWTNTESLLSLIGVYVSMWGESKPRYNQVRRLLCYMLRRKMKQQRDRVVRRAPLGRVIRERALQIWRPLSRGLDGVRKLCGYPRERNSRNRDQSVQRP